MKVSKKLTKAIAFGITVLFFWGVKPDPMPSMLTVAVLSAAMYEVNCLMTRMIWMDILADRRPAQPKQTEKWHYEAFGKRDMSYDMSYDMSRWADEKIGA